MGNTMEFPRWHSDSEMKRKAWTRARVKFRLNRPSNLLDVQCEGEGVRRSPRILVLSGGIIEMGIRGEDSGK